MKLISEIRSDIKNHGGNGVLKSILVFFLDARFRILLNFRIGQRFHLSNIVVLRFISKYYAYKLITKRSCQISYNAKLGRRVKFMHPLGVVIGDDVVIGDNVKIWQQVTLGSHGKDGLTLDYPVVESDVKIYAGAKVIGGITLGQGSIIGANSVIVKNVEPFDTVVGVPGKSLKKRH